ncbi:MAG: carboxypeptidase-like regulatory domain-containing protein [Blastocatellia bacterium]
MIKQNLLSLLLLCCLCAPLYAQSNTGTIIGEVVDATKAVVPGARLRVTNAATNQTQETTTTSAGIFSLASLQPGAYSVTVEAAGFKKAQLARVEVLTAGAADPRGRAADILKL